MANATRNTKIEVKEVEVPDGYILTLTDEEAATLVDILHMVGGGVLHTRRRHADSIAGTLRTVGMHGTSAFDLTGEMFFVKSVV